MTVEAVFIALFVAALLLVVGKWLRQSIPLLASLYLPSSIIAGLIALLIGPQILGGLFTQGRLAEGLIPPDVLDIWAEVPKLLISVVFAALFLGKTIPSLPEIWRKAGPMVAHGQTIAWGQYVVGISLTMLILTPFFGVNPLAGALIEISFEGGHGTAAGLAGTFEELGFAEGADLALGLATVGVVAGVLLGTVLVNIAVRRGVITLEQLDADEAQTIGDHDSREIPTKEESSGDTNVEPLGVHLGYIALAIGAGWLLLEGLVWLESVTTVAMGAPELMRFIPLFPFAMIGGVIVQIAATRLGLSRRIDRQIVNRISGASLDFLILAAMATLSLSALGENLAIFGVLAAGAIAWNLFAMLYLAPRMFPENYFSKGIANFGQGMGMTVIGLLLIRMTDPKNRTGAMESFGYKQLLFEPVVGGGLFTAASLPLLAQFGSPVMLGVVTFVMVGWLIFGLRTFGPRASASPAASP